MKVYVEEFEVFLNGNTVHYAAIKEAVSDALLMSAPIESCLFMVKTRGYEVVNKVDYQRTTEFYQLKDIDRMMDSVASGRTYH